MNQSYTEFAAVYDELMTDIPYDAYVELIAGQRGGLMANGYWISVVVQVCCPSNWPSKGRK